MRFTAIAVGVCLLAVLSSAQGQTAKLFTNNNVLAAGNYNDGTDSSDVSLILQVEVNGQIVVDEGADVKYVVPDVEYPGWTTTTYNDSKWESGVSGVGYADGDDNTLVPGGRVASIFTRYRFNAPTASGAKSIIVRADFDDAYIIWLNGVEIARHASMNAHAPAGTVPPWDVTAPRGKLGTNHEASNLAAGKPNKARWAHGLIGTHTVTVSFGGVSALAVEPSGKAATAWAHLKRP